MPIFSLPQLSNTADSVVSELSDAIRGIGGDADLLQQIQQEIADLKQQAQAFHHVHTSDDARARIAKFVHEANVVATAAESLPLPPRARIILTLVRAALSLIESSGTILFPEQVEQEAPRPRPTLSATGYFFANAEVIRASDQKA